MSSRGSRSLVNIKPLNINNFTLHKVAYIRLLIINKFVIVVNVNTYIYYLQY